MYPLFFKLVLFFPHFLANKLLDRKHSSCLLTFQSSLFLDFDLVAQTIFHSLPSEVVLLEQALPTTSVALGKFGCFFLLLSHSLAKKYKQAVARLK